MSDRAKEPALITPSLRPGPCPRPLIEADGLSALSTYNSTSKANPKYSPPLDSSLGSATSISAADATVYGLQEGQNYATRLMGDNTVPRKTISYFP